MHNRVIYELAGEGEATRSIDRLVNLYWALSSVLIFEVPGAVVEVGCNTGKTSVFFQMLIDHYDPERELHLFDSFQGLPSPGRHDAYLKEGDYAATVEDVREEFRRRNLRQPHVHAGWFSETLARCPDPISFAYLDSDFYHSILTSLEEVYPRLSHNGIVIVDDYCDRKWNPRAWDGLPGVKKACDDFISDKVESFSVLCGTGDLPFGLLRKL